jgi:hypothetical protein
MRKVIVRGWFRIPLKHSVPCLWNDCMEYGFLLARVLRRSTADIGAFGSDPYRIITG